jgi:hypothetical protein
VVVEVDQARHNLVVLEVVQDVDVILLVQVMLEVIVLQKETQVLIVIH